MAASTAFLATSRLMPGPYSGGAGRLRARVGAEQDRGADTPLTSECTYAWYFLPIDRRPDMSRRCLRLREAVPNACAPAGRRILELTACGMSARLNASVPSQSRIPATDVDRTAGVIGIGIGSLQPVVAHRRARCGRRVAGWQRLQSDAAKLQSGRDSMIELNRRSVLSGAVAAAAATALAPLRNVAAPSPPRRRSASRRRASTATRSATRDHRRHRRRATRSVSRQLRAQTQPKDSGQRRARGRCTWKRTR